MVSDLVVGTVARSPRDTASAAEREADMKDRVPDDLDFAGNAGKGVLSAQAAHLETS
jgi:hypothetical protein